MKSTWYSPGASFGEGHTYAIHPLAKMPRVPARLSATFDWLAPSSGDVLAYADIPEYEAVETPAGMSPEEALLQAIVGPEPVRKPSRPGWEHLDKLVADAAALGLVVPSELVTFLSRPELFQRVTTVTACYLDLSRRLLKAPVPGARLIRFLNDQQCSVLWYVMLEPRGRHRIVAAFPKWKSGRLPVNAPLDDIMTPRDVVRCAPSFLEFIYRFWIENAIWYAEHREPSSPAHARTAAVRRQRAPSTRPANETQGETRDGTREARTREACIREARTEQAPTLEDHGAPGASTCSRQPLIAAQIEVPELTAKMPRRIENAKARNGLGSRQRPSPWRSLSTLAPWR